MAFTYIGEINAVAAASGTALSTPAAVHTTGNHLFVHIVFSATGTVAASVTDTAGNTYTPLTQHQATGQLIFGQWFYCLNAIGNAANVVTLTLGAARANRLIRVLEYASPTAQFDKEVTVASGAALSISTPAFDTPREGIVLVGKVNWNSETSLDFGAAYTGLPSLHNFSKQAHRTTTGVLTGEVITYTSTVSTARSMQVLSVVSADGVVAATFNAAASAVATSTASLSTQINLSASASASATASAALTTSIQLASSPSATATASAALSTQITPAANASAQAAAAAALTTGISLSANASATASATASLLVPSAGLAASAVASASASANLSTSIALAAVANASATSTASLTTAVRLAASAIAQASATAALTVPNVGIAASASAQATATANLTTAIRLAASAASSASASADLATGSSIRPIDSGYSPLSITSGYSTLTIDSGYNVLPIDPNYWPN